MKISYKKTKSIIQKIVLLLSVVLLSACSVNNSTLPENYIDNNGMVISELVEVSREKIIINYINTSENRFTFGERFILQSFKKGSWKKVRTSLGVFYNDLMYVVLAGEETPNHIAYNLEINHGKLKDGHYRIIQDMEISGESKYIQAITEFVLP